MTAIITARLGSERLEGKVMLPLADKPVLGHLIERVRSSNLFDSIVLATSTDPANAALVRTAIEYGIDYYQGSENDVLDRYMNIMVNQDAVNFTRFCADNPLTDMETTASLVKTHLSRNLDYTCVKNLHLPLGLVEVFSRFAVEVTYERTNADDELRRESVGIYIREHPDVFNVGGIGPDEFMHQSPYRLTLDYIEDYELLKMIFENLYKGENIRFRDVIEFLNANPEIAAINSCRDQKMGNNYWQQLDKNIPTIDIELNNHSYGPVFAEKTGLI